MAVDIHVVNAVSQITFVRTNDHTRVHRLSAHRYSQAFGASSEIDQDFGRKSKMTKRSFYELLGFKIRQARKKLSLTQTELAKKLGKGTSYICAIERGKRPISAYLVWEIEQVVGRLRD